MLIKILVCISVGLTVISGTLTGGYKTIDVKNIKDYKDLIAGLERAEVQFNEKSNSLYQHRIIDVLDAKSQVVQGSLFVVKVELAPTKCRKNEALTDLRDCEFQETAGDQIKVITVSIWSREWLKEEYENNPSPNDDNNPLKVKIIN